MSLSVFLELIEIKAKTASVIPFLLGMCYSVYYYHHLNLGLALVFFVAMFLFNMVVDMCDNYFDYYHADSQEYLEKTNVIGRENISPKLVLFLIISFSVLSALLGLWLMTKVGLAVLWMGIFCFAVGYLYSAGPIPLSSLPLGELFSGFTMGFMIILLSVYINSYQVFHWNFTSIAAVFLVALADELWISNLMLANNLCDAQEDEDNHRKTIIHFIGIKAGLAIFSLKNIIAFLIIMLLPFLKLAPKSVWLTIIIVPLVYKQNKILMAEQVKSKTFSSGVKILLIGSATYLLTYFVGLVF